MQFQIDYASVSQTPLCTIASRFSYFPAVHRLPSSSLHHPLLPLLSPPRMGETGKRANPQRDGGSDSEGKNQKRRTGNREALPDGDLVVYRILCPDIVIGSVIGKSGKVINSIRQESRAKIKVVDPFPGANERVITIYCYVKEKKEKHIDDDDMEILCPAQDGVMRVHSAIVSALEASGDSEKKQKVTAQLLVPTSQAANVIGKSGATIKKLRNKSGANIKITAKDVNNITHSCAMSYDNFVQVGGTSS